MVWSPDSAFALQDATSSAPVDDWHFDSLPFVVVVLLSDLSGATGGATVLRTGSGEELAVRIPQPGWAIVLQASLRSLSQAASLSGNPLS